MITLCSGGNILQFSDAAPRKKLDVIPKQLIARQKNPPSRRWEEKIAKEQSENLRVWP